MRRYTLVHEKVMDFVLIEDGDAERFEEFFRATYPDSGLASFELGNQTPGMPVRTDEESDRILDLFDEFNAWKKGDFCR